ncbi:hypothetical protein Q7C_2221 [Methylophaga frappieri]|uniref:Zinc finger CHCC-type domain-containing protein n=1 Tax=Methylophaga frappieri (strain ATCC BAA-2434 / DSM 25690 / JAM7) TaxID=754477 RepID=I1YKB4_METFJ|nr:zinc-finger domain-containing protein [Methylophaga frappieri]AFJ03357.1 hypothetical protein Q7C_2221 [Methylophaga frappieri]
MDAKQTKVGKYYQVQPKDLPLSCPLPEMVLWNSHPRVYLSLEDRDEVRCPYCGTLYKLAKK